MGVAALNGKTSNCIKQSEELNENSKTNRFDKVSAFQIGLIFLLVRKILDSQVLFIFCRVCLEKKKYFFPNV